MYRNAARRMLAVTGSWGVTGDAGGGLGDVVGVNRPLVLPANNTMDATVIAVFWLPGYSGDIAGGGVRFESWGSDYVADDDLEGTVGVWGWRLGHSRSPRPPGSSATIYASALLKNMWWGQAFAVQPPA